MKGGMLFSGLIPWPMYCQWPGIAGDGGGPATPVVPAIHLRPKYFLMSAPEAAAGFGLTKFSLPTAKRWLSAAVPAFHVGAFDSHEKVPRNCSRLKLPPIPAL